MKKRTGPFSSNRQTTTKRHPLGAVLMTVVACSAALTFTLAAVSPDTSSPRQQSTLGQSDRLSPGSSASADPAQLHDHINETMGLNRSQLQHVPVGPDHALEGQLTIEIDGQPMTLTYWPTSVRSEDFRVRTQLDDGSLVEFDAGPARTVVGLIDELPGSKAWGSLLDDGLHAGFKLADGRLLWIEPVSPHVDGADDKLHVLYDTEDADCEGGTCGSPHHWFERFQAENPHLEDDGGMMLGIVCEIAEIAFEVDFPMYQWLGSNPSSVVSYVNSLVNAINNNQYENQVGIIHQITEILIRTSSAADPYGNPSDPGVLLGQFRDVWRTPPENSIPRDLAHMLTNRSSLTGSTIGVAWLGTVCESPSGLHYGLSRRQNIFSCMTDLVAHEIGHNWGAGHCSCPSTTMNPSITCTNTFIGAGSNSVNQILNYKNSVNCLDPCIPPEPPANNECQNRIVVSDGSTSYTNNHATTEGPDEPALCDLFSNTQIRHDVWYEYTASCSGEMTVSLCNSSFPTKLGIYEGSTCPTQPDTITACDVLSCPINTFSEIIMPVTQGETFIIRIGGRVDQTGSGTLQITCDDVSAPCPADLTGNDEVGVDDLFELLSQWGPCANPADCPADLTGNDEVGVDDLFELLSQWGPCP